MECGRLNGWQRGAAAYVLVGTGIACAGCGRDRGDVCVAFEDEWAPPEKLPDWPFDAATCPICDLQDRLSFGPEDKLTARLKALQQKTPNV